MQALQQSTVAAQLGGNVLQLAVKAGDRVKAGQLLARIDERDAQAGLARSEAAVAQAEAELRNARLQRRAHARAAQPRASSARPRWTSPKPSSRPRRPACSRRSRAAPRPRWRAAIAAVTAPFDAVVLATHVEAGELATPGRPLVTLYAPGRMRAVVQVPASRSAAARGATAVAGAAAGAPTAAGSRRPRRTELPGTDPVSQTIEWRLDLPRPTAPACSPARTCACASRRAAAAGRGAPGRLTVPAAAVLRRGELTAVYAAQDNGFVLKAVRLGAGARRPAWRCWPA